MKLLVLFLLGILSYSAKGQRKSTKENFSKKRLLVRYGPHTDGDSRCGRSPAMDVVAPGNADLNHMVKSLRPTAGTVRNGTR